MELIDTHCHIDVTAFDADRQAVLNHCRQLGVSRLVVPGIAANSWEKQRQLCADNPALFPGYGLHPVYLDAHGAEDVAALEALLQSTPAIAVGEIGLDFFLPTLDKSRQQQLFETQLQVAQRVQLPVLLHVRKSHDAVLASLRRHPVVGGICHAFNGSLQQAGQYIALGFKLGFGGMLTYERSNKLRRLARELPVEAIVLETDAPDMTVASHHGQRNSPEYLPECLAALAEARDEDVDYLAQQTTANAEAVLAFTDFAKNHSET
jgi:TatD DNase family protein